MQLGPIMLDLIGLTLSEEERELLQHPQVGGVILFARNYENKQQLNQLIDAIRTVRRSLLIAVDHEGGRVQRFRNEFTLLPPAAELGEVYKKDVSKALTQAGQLGYVMASELIAVGIDFSFAPVLDVEQGISKVIGDRSFSHNPKAVTKIARAYIAGMRKAGMAAVGKHFPGHGGVEADSHLASPVDTRDFDTIFAFDMLPFRELVNDLAAVMPAHVIYPKVDQSPACFSKQWLQNILRDQLHFKGAIISDDLSMAGAGVMGGYEKRVSTALAAGCDMVIIANNRQGVIQVLDQLNQKMTATTQQRLLALRAKASS